MTESCPDCKHENIASIKDNDTRAHIAVCLDCRTISHVCFSPNYDHIEKDLEKVRGWGVAFSKQAKGAAAGAAIQQDMEKVLRNFREAMLMSRINKDMMLEAVAKHLEESDEKDAATFVRNLKLEVAVGAEEEASGK